MNTQARAVCPQCQRPQAVCFCAQLPPPLAQRWPVHILQHQQERRHAIGTAAIAQRGLSQCPTLICGDDAEASPELVDFCRGGVLIYPGENSADISTLVGTEPRPLLFIDASWKKSRRLLLGSPLLQSLPRYHCAVPTPSRYRIRREPRPGYVSTLEAIVAVLSTLENRHTDYTSLLAVMDWMIERQIEHMGAQTYRHNYDAGKGSR